MNAVVHKDPITLKSEPISGLDSMDDWSQRYIKEGHIWGDAPSITAARLADKLGPASKVLEIGFGYGRDLTLMLEEGHRIYGIEKASFGLSEATRQLQPYLDRGRAHLMLGEFISAEVPQESFDAVYSHRVLHLLGENGLTQAFANRVAGALKPGGLLAVSARDPRDFNPAQMDYLTENLAVYKDRPSHKISFWDKNRFNAIFGRKFEILGFEESSEIESAKNPVPSYITIMYARKKNEPTPL